MPEAYIVWKVSVDEGQYRETLRRMFRHGECGWPREELGHYPSLPSVWNMAIFKYNCLQTHGSSTLRIEPVITGS